ncbi:MAG: hypothetical protein O7C59_04335 [Rickettsia endosymbiont of Ixodes persulcatus]|nr:hypothetical protein [Rickettsia endosymbiont of Ixodes persulcatus]
MIELLWVEVHCVVRYWHVLGDGEEWVVGVKMSGGFECIIFVYIDYNMLLVVIYIALHMMLIDDVIVDLCLRIHVDVVCVDGSLVEVRVWIAKGLIFFEFFL